MPRGSGGHHRLDTPTTVGHLLARRNTEGAARVGALGLRTVRAVTHLDVDTAGIDRALAAASQLFRSRSSCANPRLGGS